MRQTERVLSHPSQINGIKLGSSSRAPPVDDEEDEDELREEEEQVKVVEEIGTFDEIIVWGHEQVPAGDDLFVRGMEEWIGFAEAMHGSATGRPPPLAFAGG